jgi:hypothetical protein
MPGVYCAHSQYAQFTWLHGVANASHRRSCSGNLQLTGQNNAANHRWLTLIAEFDRRNGWSDSATQSCAHWLNWKCGIAETARRLACDASVMKLIENDDGEPLNVGRRTRTISAPLRRMLNARDRGCRFPGCANTRFIDAHHVRHWANGGETKPSNLVSLCRFHHHAVHEGGIRIERLDDGALRFVKANGVVLDDVALGCTQAPGDWRLPQATETSRYRGDRMDLDLAVDVLMQRAKRTGDVPAGTSCTSP